MKTLAHMILGISLVSSAALADTTKTVTGQAAQALHKALAQADLPYREDNVTISIYLKSTSCSIGNAYIDNIPRGTCLNIAGSAAAVAVADALVGAGVYDEAGMSHIRPSARDILCTARVIDRAPWVTYVCTLTANFNQP